jgi:hypothetical protein
MAQAIFNLPAALVEAIPQIGEHDTTIVMHNDGVVQGLSEVPFRCSALANPARYLVG